MGKIPYDYWHRKQSGGRGEYARVIGYFEPLPHSENTQLEFVDRTTGTNIPKPLIPGVKKGFLKSCEKGLLSGHRVVGVRMVLLDGASHEVDSSEWAFFQAAEFAFQQAFEDGRWGIMEPIMKVEVVAPDEFQGTVQGMLTRRSALILSSEGSDGWFTTEVEAPLNEMFGFSSELRSSTQGKGEYSMEYSRYAPATADLQEKLILEFRESQEADSGSASPGGGGKKKKKKN